MELEFEKEVAQPFAVRLAEPQLVEVERDRKVIADRDQIFRKAGLFDVALQRLSRPLLLDIGGVRKDLVQRAEAFDELHRRLRPDTANARDVVGRVADQRQVVGDTLGRHAEPVGGVRLIDVLGRHGGRAAAPGVEQGDTVVDELVEVFVPRHDHRLQPAPGGLA